MKTFNPRNAVLAKEDSDQKGLVFPSIFEKMDEDFKKLSYKVIQDAFKELVNMSKDERAKLIKEAADDFKAKLDTHASAISATVGKHEETLASLSSTVKELSDTLSSVEKAANTAASFSQRNSTSIEAIASRPLSVLPSAPEGDDDGDEEDSSNREVLAAIDKLAVAQQNHRKQWNFSIKRDDYGRIGTITATPVG